MAQGKDGFIQMKREIMRRAHGSCIAQCSAVCSTTAIAAPATNQRQWPAADRGRAGGGPAETPMPAAVLRLPPCNGAASQLVELLGAAPLALPWLPLRCKPHITSVADMCPQQWFDHASRVWLGTSNETPHLSAAAAGAAGWAGALSGRNAGCGCCHARRNGASLTAASAVSATRCGRRLKLTLSVSSSSHATTSGPKRRRSSASLLARLACAEMACAV